MCIMCFRPPFLLLEVLFLALLSSCLHLIYIPVHNFSCSRLLHPPVCSCSEGVDSGQGWHLPDSMCFCSWRSCQLASYDERKFWGWLFVSIGSVFFVGYFFIAVISKLLPPSNIAVISAMQNDWYYCFLVPLTLPIVVVAVYFHWLNMKMFKHA